LDSHSRVYLPDNCQTIAWPLCPSSHDSVTGHHRHSKYRIILFIHTKVTCRVSSNFSPGDAESLLYMISKEITNHFYSCHVFRQWVNKQWAVFVPGHYSHGVACVLKREVCVCVTYTSRRNAALYYHQLYPLSISSFVWPKGIRVSE